MTHTTTRDTLIKHGLTVPREVPQGVESNSPAFTVEEVDLTGYRIVWDGWYWGQGIFKWEMWEEEVTVFATEQAAVKEARRLFKGVRSSSKTTVRVVYVYPSGAVRTKLKLEK